MWQEGDVVGEFIVVKVETFRGRGVLTAIATEDGEAAYRNTRCNCGSRLHKIKAIDLATEDTFTVCGHCRREI